MPLPPGSSGVQELIQKLSEEGVAEGERQAQQLVRQAQQQANEILDQSRREAERIVTTARQEAERMHTSCQDSLRLAVRDTIRDLQSQINDNFRHRLRQLVRNDFNDAELLKRLIVEVARKAVPPDDQAIELLLPDRAITDEQVRGQLDDGNEDALTQLVRGLIGDSIRDGIRLGMNHGDETGIRIRVVDDDVVVELGPDAIGEVLASHLLPRFRAIMRNG